MTEPNYESVPFAVRSDIFTTAIQAHHLVDDLPTDMTALLKPGEEIKYMSMGAHEPMATSARCVYASELRDPGQAYFGAGDIGMIETGRNASPDTYSNFLGRKVLSVYSEPYGGHIFVYDSETGRRILPRGDMQGIGPDKGDRVVGLDKLLVAILAQTEPGESA